MTPITALLVIDLKHQTVASWHRRSGDVHCCQSDRNIISNTRSADALRCSSFTSRQRYFVCKKTSIRLRASYENQISSWISCCWNWMLERLGFDSSACT